MFISFRLESSAYHKILRYIQILKMGMKIYIQRSSTAQGIKKVSRKSQIITNSSQFYQALPRQCCGSKSPRHVEPFEPEVIS